MDAHLQECSSRTFFVSTCLQAKLVETTVGIIKKAKAAALTVGLLFFNMKWNQIHLILLCSSPTYKNLWFWPKTEKRLVVTPGQIPILNLMSPHMILCLGHTAPCYIGGSEDP